MNESLKYVGFWKRVIASLVDTTLLGLISFTLLIGEYGFDYFESDEIFQPLGPFDFILNWIVPFIIYMLFWNYYQSTPGKMIFKAKIVDSKTGDKPSIVQFVIRYFSYIISLLLLFLGYIWVAFDKRKQGFHDKLAKTVVVQPKILEPEPVIFSESSEEE